MKNIPKLVNYIRNYLHITDCYRPTPTDDSGGINISSYKDLPIRILYILILRIFFMMIKYKSMSNPARGNLDHRICR